MIGRHDHPESTIHIDRIITIFYREFTTNFTYAGERHDFWELVYIDQGEILVTAGDEQFLLKQGDVAFHEPNEFHALHATNRAASNVIIISFECQSPSMSFFVRNITHLRKGQSQLLAKIIQEAYGAYTPDPTAMHHNALADVPRPFGAHQMIFNYLELFLIELVRGKREPINEARQALVPPPEHSMTDSQIIEEIIAYMKAHMEDNLRYEDIIDRFFIGSTYLKVFFRRQTGMSVMKYYRMLKMNMAKKYIREENLSHSQIAMALGFDNVQYFSTCFKRCFNMTPSEYKRSIQLLEYETKLQEEPESRPHSAHKEEAEW